MNITVRPEMQLPEHLVLRIQGNSRRTFPRLRKSIVHQFGINEPGMELYTGPMASKQDKSEKLGGIHAGELIRQFLMKYIFSTKIIKNRPNFTTLSPTFNQ